VAEKEKWKTKLDKLNEEMQLANDRVHNAKMNQRALVQKHLDDTSNAEMMLQNYIESLEEENDELRAELKAAITDKRAAVRKSEKDQKLAKSHLDKWHAERLLRREFEDRAAEQEKVNQAMKNVLDKYQEIINESLETKCRLKKEWADEEAAHHRGGARRWPVWVVQLICDFG
jgi:hypothetical protein